MKKTVKVILVFFLIIVLGVVAFGSTLIYSYKKADYSVGGTTLTPNINFDILDLTYVGFIITTTPIEIVNGGLYAIRDLNVTVSVYGANFSISSLNGALLSKGINLLGDIEPKETLNRNVVTNITYEIVLLAVQDGDFVLNIDISFKVDFVLFKYKFSTEVIQVEHWDAPFGI
ncbi:MAG: hypothetical protein ACTSX6_03035 [Candidatus Heimdallarchaeaceae archaeon]